MKTYIKTLLIVLCLTISGCACFGGQQRVIPPMATGDITVKQLLSTYHTFNEEYEMFTLSNKDADLVKSWPKNMRVEVFFGTWCHDSEREVPRLLKAMNDDVAIKLIALDYEKTEPLGRAVEAEIQFTPTFLIFLDNKLIGKIVERPSVSLVEDINILIKKEA
ncbi:thioredoxin family protein [Thalassotalea profundi]|nr:thioredoxin family protein [Thalassotalea profundi]